MPFASLRFGAGVTRGRQDLAHSARSVTPQRWAPSGRANSASASKEKTSLSAGEAFSCL